MDEDELVIAGRQPVVNDNVYPLTKVPETEVKHATVAAVTEVSLFGNNLKGREGEGRLDCRING